MEDLKKLLAAATPGPWEVSERTMDWRPQVVSTEHGPICTMHIPEVGDADPNAALIVAAVNALPELLERVKRYEDALDEIEAQQQYLRVGGAYVDDTGQLEAGLERAVEIARAALKDTP